MTRPKRKVATQVTDNQILVHGINAFAIDLYANLRSQEGNLFFSPLSISTALAMTYAGADEKTAVQMAEVLHFALEQEKLHSAFKTQMKDFTTKEDRINYHIIIANALWIQQGYSLLNGFLNTIKMNYGESLFEVDYAEPEKVRQRINGWVGEQTQQKITDLIGQGVLNALTRLVLTNAIYFKGNWQFQFRKTDTIKAPFKLASGDEVKVPMMYKIKTFGFTEGPDFQALELPYAGDDLSMVILLPQEERGLTNLENTLTMEKLASWLVDIHQQKVKVFLPRFTMNTQFHLNEVLKEMGMLDAFSDQKADFSGITGPPGLYISDIIHKAFVDVNEEGTEAAAATAVVMLPRAMEKPRPIPVFRADHPFLFFIRNVHTKSILFIGLVMNPKD